MPSRTFAIVVSRVYLPPGWAKLWWFADDIQYDHQHKLQKKAPRFFSGRIHAPADSFISKNEGMNEAPGQNHAREHRLGRDVARSPGPYRRLGDEIGRAGVSEGSVRLCGYGVELLDGQPLRKRSQQFADA